ncbi:hypothetical protein KY284_020395 [Solanum tuberosum]|nr:hypothetical protein KY284_020395 [Solanum tuberosum]
MDEKRAKGLCFFCDDKYVVGHKCRSNKQIFLVEREYVELVQEEVVHDQIQEDNEEVDEFMTLSLQAFTGVTKVAKRLGCQSTTIMAQSISVADGKKVPTGSVCKNLTWLLQGTTFASNFLLLPLGNVDIVLGNRIIEFRYQGKKHVLRGAGSQLKSARAKSINKMIGCSATTFKLTKIPTTLPPHRGSFDHRIPLVESANPVNKRPYRYPGVKKDIIEKLVQEMIDQRVIQHNYRELNNLTVKDKFPIPIIEDLLDELGGSMYFQILTLELDITN